MCILVCCTSGVSTAFVAAVAAVVAVVQLRRLLLG
jgi:hypothetical protein